MIEAQPLQVLSAIRALSPLLFALLSLLLIPVARLERFGSKETSSGRAGAAVIAILLLSSAGALISGSGFASTLSAGLITVDPSEPGRLLVALGGPIFALIVVVGQGRGRANQMDGTQEVRRRWPSVPVQSTRLGGHWLLRALH